PSGHAPTAPGASGNSSQRLSAAQVLTIVALVLVLAFALYKLARTPWEPENAAEQGFQLGPWPIAPAAIRTRQELIQAFEYFSVLQLGPDARAWNHQDIARRLSRELKASDDPRRVQATQRLATTYEQARYAPVSDPLPEADLATARNDL